MKELIIMTNIRWNYELVNNFVNDNSDCTLLSTEFKTAKTTMLFKCKCGNKFETTFERFRLRNKRQCNDCGLKNQLDKQSLSFEDIKKFIEENSECILLSGNYVNTKTKLKLKCKCGKIFYKSFEKFKTKNKMCKECSYEEISKSQIFDYEFVKLYVESKNCELVSKQYQSCQDILEIKCSCGELYKTTFSDFKNDNQIRCKRCTNKMSKGEIIIENYLRENDMKYEPQYTFDDLKAVNNRQKLKFDFAVFVDNRLFCLIEFDGKQHSQSVDYFGGEEALKVLQENDNRKNEYCKTKGFKLIRIPYKHLKNLNSILDKSLKINYDNTVPSLVI
jgi:very-short-patch-repair endonuclease